MLNQLVRVLSFNAKLTVLSTLLCYFHQNRLAYELLVENTNNGIINDAGKTMEELEEEFKIKPKSFMEKLEDYFRAISLN